MQDCILQRKLNLKIFKQWQQQQYRELGKNEVIIYTSIKPAYFFEETCSNNKQEKHVTNVTTKDRRSLFMYE